MYYAIKSLCTNLYESRNVRMEKKTTCQIGEIQKHAYTIHVIREGIETFIVFLSADKLQTKFRSRSAYLRTVINEREWNCLTLLVAKAKVPVPLRKREQSLPFARSIAIISEERAAYR